MRYIVYIDRLFALQAIQTLALLLLTGTFLDSGSEKNAGTGRRTVLGAGGEALFFCAVFLLPGIDGRIKNLLFASGSLLMLKLVFRIHTPGLFLRAVILFHGAAFLLGGILYACLGALGRSAAVHTLPAAVCAIIAAYVVTLVWRSEKKRRENILVGVELLDKNVRIVTLALIDSGNSLHDPISGRPVSVVERSVLEGRIPLERPEKFRLVPYHTLGGRGVMQAVEIEKLIVKKEGTEIVVEQPLLGLYEGRVTGSGAYHLILNPEFKDWRNKT